MELTRLSHLVFTFCQENPHLRPLYHNYKKSLLRAHSLKNKFKFLKECREEKVVPKSCLPRRLRNLDNQVFSELDKVLLDFVIRDTGVKVKNAFKLSAQCKVLMKNSVCEDIWHLISDFVYRLLRKNEEEQKRRLKGKLDALFDNSYWTKMSDPSLFINLSSYELQKNEKLVLGFGRKFSIAKSCFNPLSIAKSFIKLEKNKSNEVTDECVSVAKGCVYGVLGKKVASNIPKRFETALRNLRRNESIHITKADKSNAIVILDKTEYNDKINALLSDNSTYSELRKDPLESVNKLFNSRMKVLLKRNPDLIKEFSQINPTLPYLYGLVKTHKPNNPLRPIVSSVGSATYKLSKWSAKMVSPLIGKISNSHVHNSSDLIDKLRKHTEPCELISFDVNSLFTKVPVDDLLTFLQGKLHLLDIPVEHNVFLELIKMCVTDNVFRANGKFYKQIFGMSMGNCLSAPLSCIYMEFFESRLLPNICDFNLPWYRYVDDVLCLWPRNKNPLEFMDKLNDLVPSISFKIEREVDGSLPFLDMIIMRNGSNFKFKVYRKPTQVDSYIHFFSNHHESIKMSVFSGMFLRCLRICDPEFIDDELIHIYSLAQKLGYPTLFVDRCLKKAQKSYYGITTRQVPTYKNILSLPYHQEFVPLIHSLKSLNIKVVFKYDTTITNRLIKNSPTLENDVGVYAIPCRDCDEIYVGQTGKKLQQRIKQHKYSIRTATESSAVFVHIRDNNHVINWNNSKIIYTSSCVTERLLVESCLIREINSMNLSDGQYKTDNILHKFICQWPKVKKCFGGGEVGD